MEPIHSIADLYSKNSVHHLANSALPNAPVLPYVQPRRRVRKMISIVQRRTQRRAPRANIAVRPARYTAEC